MQRSHTVFWIGLLALGLLKLSAWAWSPADTHDIALMEQRLLHQTFTQEQPPVRLSRLENTVYGAPRQGTPEQRVSALRKALPVSPPQVVAAPAPEMDAGLPPLVGSKKNAAPPAVATPQRQADESAYPAIDELEQRVLGQTFGKEDVSVRIPRLETRVLGQPQQGDWSDRVDQLQARVLGNRAAPPPTPNGGYYDDEAMGNNAPNPAAEVDLTPDQVLPAVAQMEKQLFKQTYATEPLESRLNRLETRLFNQLSAPGYTPEQRVGRMIAVAGAGGQNPSGPRSTAANLALQLAPILIMMLPLVI
jgi:hypothetical protein